MANYQKPMFSENGGRRPLLTPEELRDACIHTAATIVVAFVYGSETVNSTTTATSGRHPSRALSSCPPMIGSSRKKWPRSRRSTKQDPWLSPSTMAEGLISSS